MKGSHHKIAKKKISIDCGKYLLRTINVDEASDRWASWMTDPEAVYLLNAPARNMTKADLIDYINRFDQKSRLLLGVFEKQTGIHIGIITIDIDHADGRFLVNYLVGEPFRRDEPGIDESGRPAKSMRFHTEHSNIRSCGF